MAPSGAEVRVTAKAAPKTGLALLREPFPPHQIGKLPKPYRSDSAKSQCQECGTYHGMPALHLDFVGHAALTDRLLDADPQWSWEPFAIGPDGLPMLDRNGGLWIRLTVCGVTRLGYGDAQGKTGPNAIKEAIGDALRNAGMRFGIALDLWHKGDLHIEEAGKQEAARQEERPAERGLLPADQNVWEASEQRFLQEWREELAKAEDKDALQDRWADLGAGIAAKQVQGADVDLLKQEWQARKAVVLAEDKPAGGWPAVAQPGAA